MRHLDIIGLGVAARQLTQEAIDCWQAADIIFSMTYRSALTAFGQGENPTRREVPWVDLYAFCDPEGSPREAYDSMVEHLFASSRSWQHGVLITDGNPGLFNEPVWRIQQAAPAHGWTVRCLPAVSSIDSIIVDLELRVEEDGLQIVDATRTLQGKTPINPSLGCLILQVNAFGDRRFGDGAARPSASFEPLRQWLLALYPATHPLHIVRSRLGPEDSSKIMMTSVDAFPKFAPLISPICSAYLPPFREP